ncbi:MULTISPECIES: M48 family metallopeptidase [unclassified Thermosynechococcus]|uniref:M48 family metallopeptidase n=1 Tax=unclassified Thermosynechococcus TaxID=2622553 RepID=UPI002672392E|nr:MULTISPECIES: M48 family metallopeptidase [unclassified Thermosynechococcus]MDR7920971.1 M48 family metallopeptidase [Thermosynechococcus sp. HY213]WKT81604.1 M48 family metallopeptidase [Thermosynechococcus sp. PP45]WNC22659.1 M48 family metallopeptidase [Thermosynechococcus sp. PP22]WNC25216.1 M48 family metallopeptidase [Thermosynechococcus sp. PP551]WNC27794.1 M48 family metallopeptidase [Thermosynechococcus sp. PP555]
MPVPAYSSLRADQFRHPRDREATQALQQLPGLDLLVRSLLGSVAEQAFYLENIGSSLRLSEQQLPDIYGLHIEACRILGLEPPQLYLKQHPVPNAYTFAMRGKQPFVVLHSSLVELLTPKELQAVLAHELGHLKCEHGVYLTIANLLLFATSQLSPWGLLLAQGLQTQLMHWLRCAELTCDRAALLVTQDPRVVASVLMKLCGGSPQWSDRLNLDAFIAQARDYEAADRGWYNLFKELQASQLTHPLPVLRAREILDWAETQQYDRLVKQLHPARQ